MDLRQKTDALVEKFRSLGIQNVYVNPPESVRMQYPCVKIKRSGIYTTSANNHKYMIKDRYDAVYITREPDDPMVHKILYEFDMSRFSMQIVKDDLYNENFVIYF